MKNNIIKYKKFSLHPIVTDGKPGELIDLNLKNICLKNEIPFTISKCFYLNELNSELSRGNHSNTNASEILICLKGSFEIKLHDGIKEKIFKLKKNDAIYINKNIWVSYYNFNDCIIMAFVNIFNNDKTSCYNFNDFISNNNK
jgi:oxalate decarboxylase/phosphoglucose isomerase-like protein (cupin superfamily)